MGSKASSKVHGCHQSISAKMLLMILGKDFHPNWIRVTVILNHKSNTGSFQSRSEALAEVSCLKTINGGRWVSRVGRECTMFQWRKRDMLLSETLFWGETAVDVSSSTDNDQEIKPQHAGNGGYIILKLNDFGILKYIYSE